jgi:hypothetical protein
MSSFRSRELLKWGRAFKAKPKTSTTEPENYASQKSDGIIMRGVTALGMWKAIHSVLRSQADSVLAYKKMKMKKSP